LIVESHFDFQKQAVLYLPDQCPIRAAALLDASVLRSFAILEVTSGPRVCRFYTSVSSMRETYERVRDLIDFPTFIQGQGSKTVCQRFRKTEGAVLFANLFVLARALTFKVPRFLV